MEKNRENWIMRVLLGGLAGDAVLLLIGFLAGSLSIYGDNHFRGLILVDGAMVLRLGGNEALAIGVQLLLCFLLGACAGVATLPFADGGRELTVRSLVHLVLTAALTALTAWLNFGLDSVLLCLALLAAVYFIIWLARWIGWYAEAAAIGEKLGLAPGLSPLRWRETLLYLPFALALCWGLPLLLRALDPHDVPALSGVLLPYLLLPMGGFFSGLSMGKRYGLCPLFPVACFVCYLPMVYLLFNESALFHCFMIAVPALAGNVLGALWQKRNTKHTAGKEEKP